MKEQNHIYFGIRTNVLGVGISSLDMDAAVGHALNAALAAPVNQIEVWSSDFLERHNWSNVINAMIPVLNTER